MTWGVHFRKLGPTTREFRTGLVSGEGERILETGRYGIIEAKGGTPHTFALVPLYQGFTTVAPNPQSPFIATVDGRQFTPTAVPAVLGRWTLAEIAAYAAEDSPTTLFVARIDPKPITNPPARFYEETGLDAAVRIELYGIAHDRRCTLMAQKLLPHLIAGHWSYQPSS